MGQLTRTLVGAHGRPSRCRAFSALFPRAHSSSLQLRKGEVVAARENEEGGAAGGRAARPRRSGTDVSWRTLLGARVTAVRRPREALDSSGDEKDGEYERIEAK